MDERIVQELRASVRGEVLLAEPLSRHTTYRLGGPAEALVRPWNSREAASIYARACSKGIPLSVVGAGSNVIAPDEGLAGIVLQMTCVSPTVRFRRDGRVYADAGLPLAALVDAAARHGLAGLEPLAGIPGTVGGAVVMNAGTKDAEVSMQLVGATVIFPSGRSRSFSRAELGFGYRRSVVLGSGWLVTGAEFALSPGEPERSKRMIEERLADRARKFPLDLPSAGSVFKRPPGDYAGRLIETAGCKGMRVGGAVVSERHANFIVNDASATAADVLELISRVRGTVFAQTGVYLELEQIPLSSPAARR
jgi:UDP-N-acetylmuramate dehydrogenase